MSTCRLSMRLAVTLAGFSLLAWIGPVAKAQTTNDKQTASSRTITVTDAAGRKHTRAKPITTEEKMTAAARLKAKQDAAIAAAQQTFDAALAAGVPLAAPAAALAAAIAGTPSLLVGPNNQLIPDYSGMTPNWALSPAPSLAIDPLTGLPAIDPATGLPIAAGGGIRKFVDRLPGLGQANANLLGQYLPIAVPDAITHPGSDYYEIALVEYSEQLHSDLAPTKLRGYVQEVNGVQVGVPHYLGPIIVAQRNRPVRIKFTNRLPVGAGGNLFLPVDTTIMGAGPGPTGPPGTGDIACMKGVDGTVPSGCYTENRATLHLHGGVTPWISDGTPYQWITPATENTPYPEGVSVYNVPDMPNPGKPGSLTNPSKTGVQTFYYTNEQSARLMFYHDHASGITRLNVYAGEAAGYLITDAVEQDLVSRGIIPADQIPLVIQDKTFVDATTIRTIDPTWNWGTGTTFTPYTDPTGKTIQMRDPVTGDLWLPHVYMPAQNPFDITGVNPMGRWPYGPWFFPPAVVPYGPIPNPYYDCNAFGQPDATHPCTMPWQPVEIPGTPNPSWGAEAFMDTPLVNGTVYPTLTVEPKAYRLRILNAANDRFWNLQLYVAADKTAATTTEAITAGLPSRLCDGLSGAAVANCTEVRMVAASPATPGLPATWPTDGRVGGAPDPTTVGPSFIQIGTEGGFLPMPVVIAQQPITWNLDPTTFNFGNVADHALLLGPAERADVIVDFSAYVGKTLILYNDAPAPFPAYMGSNDYFTGAPDMTGAGGAPTPLPGYGPNIRTIMQINVAGTPAAAIDVNAIMTVWAPTVTPNPDPTLPPTIVPGVFQQDQDPIIVGQTAYNQALGMTFPAYYPAWGIARIQDSSMMFQTATGSFVTLNFQPKAIHDEMGATFDDYGRSSAKLGLELPKPTPLTANFVMQGYSDPPTELVMLSKYGTPIGGPLNDGTQIWKITHNGVDTHPVHFHLFHVQLINRVGWDGAIRLPDANELGWKDTLRISPLEDTIVALRPIAPDPMNLPWKIPNSHRPLNPALPLGSSIGFSGLDPLGNNVTVFNDVANFGWEYVWHCHILSHEENDMMRGVVFAVAPSNPLTLTAVVSGSNRNRVAVLSWVDGDAGIDNKTGFTVERSSDPSFATGVTTIPLGVVTTYTDPIGANTTPMFYRVMAVNTVGSTVAGFPTMTAKSEYSNIAAINPIAAPGPLTATLQAGPRVVLSFIDNATNETGFVVERGTDGVTFAPIATLPARNNTGAVNYSDTAPVAGATNYYRVKAINGLVSSAYSNIASVTLPVPPAAPSSLAATAAVVSGNQDTVTLTWTDNANNETGFQLQRDTVSTFATNPQTFTIAANATTVTQTGINRGATYYYRIRAVNLGGGSAWSNTVTVVTP